MSTFLKPAMTCNSQNTSQTHKHFTLKSCLLELDMHSLITTKSRTQAIRLPDCSLSHSYIAGWLAQNWLTSLEGSVDQARQLQQ